MLDAILRIAQTVIGLGVLLVAIGRWGGRLESRSMRVTPAPEPSTNGSPSNGELLRRFEQLEKEFREDRRNYLPVDVANAKFDGVWAAIKGLREIDSAQQRRIDNLMGQGG